LSSSAKLSVAIDGSKFKAVNTRDRNFTKAKMQLRLAQIDESIARYGVRTCSAPDRERACASVLDSYWNSYWWSPVGGARE
jgi:transposase